MKSYSITILPDSIRGKQISFTVSGNVLWWGIIAGFILSVFAGALIYNFIIAPYGNVQNQSTYAQQLISENRGLENRIESSLMHMDRMAVTLEDQLRMTDKLYFIFGITEVGGGGYSVQTNDQYAAMLDKLEIIEQRYSRLDNYLNLFDNLPIRLPLELTERLSSDFGPRRSPFSGNVEMHRGVDLVAPRGTAIYAAGGGEVVMAGRWQDYDSGEYGRLGKFVLIRHGDSEYETIYGHCSSVLVEKGEFVKPGQLIARVGSTGWSTGPHLHFAIIHKKQFVDPKLYLLHFDSSKFLEQVLKTEE